MPTKRRIIIFLIVLTVMLLLKRVVGQETATVGWEPAYTCGGYGGSMPDEAQSILAKSAMVGLLLGVFKIGRRTFAERRGTYLTGDLIELRLR